MDIYMIILIITLIILIIGVICIYYYKFDTGGNIDNEEDEDDTTEDDNEGGGNIIKSVPFLGITNTTISSGNIDSDGWVSENSYNDNGEFIGKNEITVGDTIYNGEWIQFQLNCTKQTNYTIRTDNIEFAPCNIVILVSNDGTEWIKYKEESKCNDVQEKVVFIGNDIITTYCKIIVLNIKPYTNNNESRPTKINYISITECVGLEYFKCNHKTKMCEPSDLKTAFRSKFRCIDACYLWNCNYDTGICTEIDPEGSNREISSNGDEPENIECKNTCEQTKFIGVSPTQSPTCYYHVSCGSQLNSQGSKSYSCRYIENSVKIQSGKICENGTHASFGFDSGHRQSNSTYSTTNGLYTGSERVKLTNGQTIAGEWIGMSTPLAIVVVRYKLECNPNVFNSWVLVANNDPDFKIESPWNSTWNILDSRAKASLYDKDGIVEIGMIKKDRMFTIDIENTTEYKNYLIVITSLKSGYSSFNITYFNLYTL